MRHQLLGTVCRLHCINSLTPQCLSGGWNPNCFSKHFITSILNYAILVFFLFFVFFVLLLLHFTLAVYFTSLHFILHHWSFSVSGFGFDLIWFDLIDLIWFITCKCKFSLCQLAVTRFKFSLMKLLQLVNLLLKHSANTTNCLISSNYSIFHVSVVMRLTGSLFDWSQWSVEQ